MAHTYEQLIAILHTNYANANTHRYYLNKEINEASLDWNAGDDHAAIHDIIEGLGDIRDCIVDILGGGFYGYNSSTYALPTALDYDMAFPAAPDIEEYELTMAAILNTMLTADPEQTLYFVGLVDAYRQSVWNRPFNREFFAALARGFAEWP